MVRCAVASLAAITVAAGTAGSASAAVTRYAKPFTFKAASGAPCTDSAHPCELADALAQATTGDDVQLAKGDYFAPGDPPQASGTARVFGPGGLGGISSQDPYATQLMVPAGVTLHGTDPAVLPVIHVQPTSQGVPGVFVQDGATIRDLAIFGTGTDGVQLTKSASISTGALAERVRIRMTAAASGSAGACSMGPASTMRDAVCQGTGNAGGSVTALSAASLNAGFTIHNVTAITTAPDSVGLNFGDSNGTSTADISNSIFRGTQTDISVRAGLKNGNAKATIDHSNWVSQTISAHKDAATGNPDAVAQIIDNGGNQTGAGAAEPLFFNAATGDFRQVTGSPTIDAGIVSPSNGTLALGGAARKLGLTSDIGADEFDPAHPLVAPTPTPTPSPTPTPTPASTPTPTPTPPPGGGNTLTESTLDRTAPVLSGLTLGKSVKRSKGTTIRFTLSEPAKVTLAFGQPKAGRLVGTSCRTATSKNRTKPKCTIANVRGTLTVDGKLGPNTLSFKGKVGKKLLALGGYTLTANATDPAGNAAAPATKRFTLAR